MWRIVHNGATQGASIGVCDCGREEHHFTGAGMQQLGWWVQLGLSLEEAEARVLDGDYPWELNDGRPWMLRR